MGYVYLTISIVAEVIGTSALKASGEFTRLVPSTIVVVVYAVAFYTLSIVLRTVPVGIVVHRQVLDWLGMLGISLIITGVVVINVFSKVSPH